jgi:hypothetical protein
MKSKPKRVVFIGYQVFKISQTFDDQHMYTWRRADLRVAAFTAGSFVELRSFPRSSTRTSIELQVKSYAR